MIKRFIVSLLLYTASSTSWSSNIYTTIDAITIAESMMLIYIFPTGGITSPPACHGSNGDYYSISMTRPLANKLLDALLSAQAHNVRLSFTGAGDCIDQSVSETLDYFTITE